VAGDGERRPAAGDGEGRPQGGDGERRPAGGRGRHAMPAAAVLALLAAAGLVAAGLALLGGDEDRRRHRPTAPAPRPAPPARPATPGGAGPPALPAPSTPALGINVNRVFNDRAFSPEQIDAHLAAVRATGVELARSDAHWSAAEPEPPAGPTHRYDWTFNDTVAGALAAHGLRWLAIIDYSAGWAASVPGDLHSAPRSSADYAAYAGAFAARYGRGGTFWAEHPELPALPVTTFEIWNEPDSAAFWAPAPDAARYMDLYVRARNAIKAADPEARVVIGGLIGAPTYLPQLLAARPDARGHVDGVAIHPYASNPLGVVAGVRDARRALDALEMPDVALYVTEFGWVTSPASSPKYAPAARRPRYIAATVEALARTDCGVAAIVLYTWVTPERNRGDEEDWFGIRHRDDRDRADRRALAGAATRLPELVDAPRVELCG